ncbi:MAG TPA: SusC/RagA family protein, partial [Rikenellaceae bacterium]|nr:SusC/RagA family protein [Rikenellaceae bacterium]
MNRIMKLAGFIRWGCCFLCIALLAMSAEAQTKGITISVKNTPAKEVLEVLKRDYGYFFLYNEDEVKLDRNVSVSVKDAGIAEVMDKILWKGLDYKVRNRQVIITRTPVQTSRSADMRKEPRPERTITVSGVVTDGSGNQLIGVGVIEKGTKNGVVTDGNGKYEITLHDSGAVLVFTSLGYVSEERSPVKSQVVNVVLKEDFQMLDDVVVVGYGKQKKESITGAISTISKDDLVQTPQANLSNMLVGRMPGLIATQRSGAPGEDYSNLMIRGVGSFTGNASPLIMVDGVERSNFDGIDPNEIESLNILKDASATAVYGVRGANGVILVTTRQGELGAPKVSYSGSFALQQSTALPDYLNSEQYATLYNEAQKNDSVSDGTAYVPRFSEKDIELYRNHKDPIMHPDNDWIDSMLRRFSTRTQHNVNISGGIDRVKYFISGSFFDQTGIYKHTRIDSDHDVNPRATRYNFRSNLDFQVTRDLTARFQFATQISDVKSSGNGNSDIWKGMSWSNPLMSPGIVDGKIITIENAVGSQNPWKWLYNNGYRESRGNNINSAVNIDYDFSQLVTKGLSAKVKIAYDSYYSSVKRHGKVFTDYLARRGDNGELYIFPQSEESIWYNDAAGWGKDRKLYIEAGINYDRAFGSHHISALALYNQSKYWSPSLAYLVPNAYQGIVGRVTYEYASRYLFEFDMGYNGTENFAVGHRFGFFPAVSAGWILTEEDWLPDNEILTYMKIRASYGEVGNDKIGGARFLYLPTSYSESWEELYKYRFGVSYNPTESNAMIEGKMGNPDLTWERARKTNLGLDFNMFKGRLSIQSDVFYEYRDNILANRSTVPDIVGADL